MSVRYLCALCRGVFTPHTSVVSEFSKTPKIPSRSALSADLAWSAYSDQTRRTAEGAIICPLCGDKTGVVKTLSIKWRGSEMMVSDMPYIRNPYDQERKELELVEMIHNWAERELQSIMSGIRMKKVIGNLKRKEIFEPCSKIVDKEHNRKTFLFRESLPTTVSYVPFYKESGPICNYHTEWCESGARVTFGNRVKEAMKADPEFRVRATRAFEKCDIVAGKTPATGQTKIETRLYQEARAKIVQIHNALESKFMTQMHGQRREIRRRILKRRELARAWIQNAYDRAFWKYLQSCNALTSFNEEEECKKIKAARMAMINCVKSDWSRDTNETVPFMGVGISVNAHTYAELNTKKSGLIAIWDAGHYEAKPINLKPTREQLLELTTKVVKESRKAVREGTSNEVRDSFPIGLLVMSWTEVMDTLYPTPPSDEPFGFAEYHGNVESSEPQFGKFRYGQRRPSPATTPTSNARNIGKEMWEREHSSETFWRRWREWSEAYKVERARSVSAARSKQ